MERRVLFCERDCEQGWSGGTQNGPAGAVVVALVVVMTSLSAVVTHPLHPAKEKGDSHDRSLFAGSRAWPYQSTFVEMGVCRHVVYHYESAFRKPITRSNHQSFLGFLVSVRRH